MLGIKPERLLDDTAELQTYVAIRDRVKTNRDIKDFGRRQALLIEEEGWPFPYALARDDDHKWSFDTMAGLEEIEKDRWVKMSLRLLQRHALISMYNAFTQLKIETATISLNMPGKW